ncbi:unnamed protein product, partial [Prorocentrum cordatum]
MPANSEKEHLSIVIWGHVDSGASTNTGRVIFELGGLPERELEKLKAEAERLGKGPFAFAFYMDRQKEERERGVTIACTTQGLAWARNDNVDKLAALVRKAQGLQWDIGFLSDVHTREPATVCVEQFTLLVGHRTAFIMSHSAMKAWHAAGSQQWRVGEHVLAITLLMKGVLYACLCVYLPSSRHHDLRRQVVADVDSAIGQLPQGAVVILSGDLNSHIGEDALPSPHVGTHRLSTPTTASGSMLQDSLSGRKLRLADSFAPIYSRGTWQHPPTKKWYELDVFLADPRASRRMHGWKVFPASFSDHHGKLCRLTLAASMKSRRRFRVERPERPRPLSVSRFKGRSPEAKQLCDDYSAKTAEAMQQAPPDGSWTVLAGIMVKACEDTAGRDPERIGLPYLAGHAKEAIKRHAEIERLLTAVKESKDVPTATQARTTLRQARAALKRDKRRWKAQWVSSVCGDLEQALHWQDMGRFYRGLRSLGVDLAKFSTRGQQEFTSDQIAEHFAKIGAEPNEVDVEALELPPPRPKSFGLGEPPEDEEIDLAWRKMRPSAAGHDEVRIELIRLSAPEMRAALRDLVRRLWTTPPEEWEESVSVSVGIALFKQKGSKKNLDNYRLISLLTLISRTIARIVSQRLSAYGESVGLFINEQWGFRSHRGTLDAILLVRLIAEISTRGLLPPEAKRVMLTLFDIKKAYANQSLNGLWAVLDNVGVPESLLQVIRGLIEQTQYIVRTADGDSEPYSLQRGLREGCPASCVEFNMYHNVALQQLEKTLLAELPPEAFVTFKQMIGQRLDKSRGKLGRCRVLESAELLRAMPVCFADDTSLLHREDFRAQILELTTRVLAVFGETVHPGKTESVAFGRHTPGEPPIPDDCVRAAKLLGSWFDSLNDMADDSYHRLEKAKRIWWRLYKQLPRLRLSTKHVRQVLQSSVVGSLLYACETRAFSQRELDQYQVFLDRVVRNATHTKMTDMKGTRTMTDVRKGFGIDSVRIMVGSRQLRYAGHGARLPESRTERRALWVWLVPGAETTSGSQKTIRGQWWARIQELCALEGVLASQWATLACEGSGTPQKGDRWKAAIKKWVEAQRVKEAADTEEGRRARREAAAPERARAAEAMTQAARTATGLYVCGICSRELPQKTWKQHFLACEARAKAGRRPPRVQAPQQCEYCGKMFVHLRIHYSSCSKRAGPVLHARSQAGQRVQAKAPTKAGPPLAAPAPSRRLRRKTPPPPVPLGRVPLAAPPQPPPPAAAPPRRRLRGKTPPPPIAKGAPAGARQHVLPARAPRAAPAPRPPPAPVMPPPPPPVPKANRKAARLVISKTRGQKAMQKLGAVKAKTRTYQYLYICPYCHKEVNNAHIQQGQCDQAPFDVWRSARLRKLQAAAAKSGPPMAEWQLQCAHCGLPAVRRPSAVKHMATCRAKRLQAELPCDQFPVDRPGLAASPVLRAGSSGGVCGTSGVQLHRRSLAGQTGGTCTTKEFYTEKRHYTVIDAPGHRDFIKNMITGASQANVPFIMVLADGNFTTAIAKGNRKAGEIQGQTRQHSRLINLLGVKQICIGDNKMDCETAGPCTPISASAVADKQSRYDEIANEMKSMLVKVGWKKDFVEKGAPAMPISGWIGDNLLKKSDNVGWWKDCDVEYGKETIHVDTVHDVFDVMCRVPERPTSAPMRMPISGIYKIKGVGDALAGRVEQGMVKPGEEVAFLPARAASNPCTDKVFTVEMHHQRVDFANPGDNVGLNIEGLDKNNMSRSGDVVVYKKDTTLGQTKEFDAQIQVLDIPNEIKVGYSPIGFVRCGCAACRISKLKWKMGKDTGGEKTEDPRSLMSNEMAQCSFQPQQPLVHEMGRVAIVTHGDAFHDALENYDTDAAWQVA